MKVSCAVKEITVKQRALANAIGITPARVSQLVKEGVVVRNNDDKGGGVYLYDSVKNYWLTQRKPDEAEAEETIDYMTEKARHEKTKREIAELKLQKMERNAYTARTVELVMTEMLANLRTQLLGLPSKLAPQLDGKTKEQIYTIMTSEIEEKLSELSEYTPELFAYDEVEEVGADENSD